MPQPFADKRPPAHRSKKELLSLDALREARVLLVGARAGVNDPSWQRARSEFMTFSQALLPRRNEEDEE